MNINKEPHTSIWYDEGQNKVLYIDQTVLPWELNIRELTSLEDTIGAINNMEVRGAPLIGVAAAFGLWLAKEAGENVERAAEVLLDTRPTAVNLKWSIERMLEKGVSLDTALDIRNMEIEASKKIGENGLSLIKDIEKKDGEPVNILTHCNAGWLACVDYGTATAPMYLAHDQGIPIHVWVDETRPRNQGAKLTAFELGAHGVPYTLIPDNTGGHLMQNGLVDLVIIGADRVAVNGDIANKIGTYLKALAAIDNDIPLYVAVPYSTFDPETKSGKEIPIEERSTDEVKNMNGKLLGKTENQDKIEEFSIVPADTPTANYGFDITPAKFITAYITEKGIKKKL